MQMPFYSILSLSLFPLLAICAVALQKEPDHMQIPPSGDQAASLVPPSSADHCMQAGVSGTSRPRDVVKRHQ